MSKSKVIVRGGMKNLYYVSEYAGKFFVTKANGSDVGQTTSFDQALALIRSHSGREIERIE